MTAAHSLLDEWYEPGPHEELESEYFDPGPEQYTLSDLIFNVKNSFWAIGEAAGLLTSSSIETMMSVFQKEFISNYSGPIYRKPHYTTLTLPKPWLGPMKHGPRSGPAFSRGGKKNF